MKRPAVVVGIVLALIGVTAVLFSRTGLRIISSVSGHLPFVDPLIGRWGRSMGALQDVGYTEFVLNPDGSALYSGRNLGNPFSETGTWKREGNVVVISLQTQIARMTLNSDGSQFSSDPFYVFQKGVHWDFNCQDYFNDLGERMQMRN